MVDSKQLEILRQGVDAWNDWRKAHRDKAIDLSKANLSPANLQGVDLSDANLERASLREAKLLSVELLRASLRGAHLQEANLQSGIFSGANLSGANFEGADLAGAFLGGVNLSNANLQEADLRLADLWGTDLRNSNLNYTSLVSTRFVQTQLAGSTFLDAILDDTVFVSVDLSKANNLKRTIHEGPSSLGMDTIRFSKGLIPNSFLLGCGLADWEIESTKLHAPHLTNKEITDIQYKIYDLRAEQSLQIYNLFISYSHTDAVFVDRLEEYLNKKGIRFWRDVHHATSGRLVKIVDRAIRINQTVLIVLSAESVKSDWVEHEVYRARKLEKEIGRDVLCPML